jgi:malonyl-CoA/methylmalonyl-CoA synthetase
MNLPALFSSSLKIAADRPGLEFNGETFTFRRLDRDSDRLATWLLNGGLARGDRVAVYLKNSPALILVYLACVNAGFIFTPINILYRQGEIAHILNDAKPRIVFADPESEELVASASSENSIQVQLANEVDQLIADTPSAGSPPEPQDDDIAALVYTSGTTGRPKGAMLTQANFAANASNLVEAWHMTSDDRLLLTLPLFHVHGLGNGLHTWLALGYRLRLMERFRKETIVADLLDFRPTVFFGVPTMYERLLETPTESAREIGSSVRLFVSGSAPLPAATHRKFEQLFGSVILERYGMSETLMNVSNPYDGERRPGSIGFPLANVSIRICDQATDGEVETGETGELHIKGRNVFSGYWRQDAATRDAFTADGYFRSGDLGVRSEDGYITLQGRGKELIICGGFNVYPREIEEFLAKQPGVSEAAVVGVKDQLKGERPLAFIVPSDEEIDPDALRTACREGLASFKNPGCFVRVDALPRNALGKVQKHLLPVPQA